MTPLMMRIFTLVGIALAAASMQSKARADIVPQQVMAAPAASVAALPMPSGMAQS